MFQFSYNSDESLPIQHPRAQGHSSLYVSLYLLHSYIDYNNGWNNQAAVMLGIRYIST